MIVLQRIKICARGDNPYRVINDGCVIVENGKIQCVSEGEVKTGDCLEINAMGNYVAPGFIDIHTHGGGGHDFMDGTVEAYLGAIEMHARHGTTTIVPTTLTSTNEELKNTFDVFRQAKARHTKGACMLGLHLEGPYFAMSQKGAQDPRYIRNPEFEEYDEILKLSDDVIRWSAAPELDGALEFGRYLKARGILPSVAHTDAIFEQMEEAFENGFTHVTHLYSGMSGVRRINAYRYAGAVEYAFYNDEMTVEIIADGVHLPASLLKLIYKIKGPDKTCLVTDAMRAAGMPEGETILGSLKNGMRVLVEDGVAKLPDRTAFAGSVATADRLVRTMVKMADVPLTDAVRMMTSTPARIIGIDGRKGALAAGMDADIVIFDENIDIKLAMVEGKTVYKTL